MNLSICLSRTAWYAGVFHLRTTNGLYIRKPSTCVHRLYLCPVTFVPGSHWEAPGVHTEPLQSPQDAQRPPVQGAPQVTGPFGGGGGSAGKLSQKFATLLSNPLPTPPPPRNVKDSFNLKN